MSFLVNCGKAFLPFFDVFHGRGRWAFVLAFGRKTKRISKEKEGFIEVRFPDGRIGALGALAPGVLSRYAELRPEYASAITPMLPANHRAWMEKKDATNRSLAAASANQAASAAKARLQAANNLMNANSKHIEALLEKQDKTLNRESAEYKQTEEEIERISRENERLRSFLNEAILPDDAPGGAPTADDPGEAPAATPAIGGGDKWSPPSGADSQEEKEAQGKPEPNKK